MKTVTLPDGREIMQPRLPREAYNKLHTTEKILSKKKMHKRQDARKVISQQLQEHEDMLTDLEQELEDYFD